MLQDREALRDEIPQKSVPAFHAFSVHALAIARHGMGPVLRNGESLAIGQGSIWHTRSHILVSSASGSAIVRGIYTAPSLTGRAPRLLAPVFSSRTPFSLSSKKSSLMGTVSFHSQMSHPVSSISASPPRDLHHSRSQVRCKPDRF